jgi:two-component system OmpR family sensor kinase
VDEGGRIALACRAEGADALIEVTDDGAGLEPDEARRIFERFYRGAPAREAGKGSGLGLTITRQIVERAGGTITAEPAAPRGTRFVIRLPRAT